MMEHILTRRARPGMILMQVLVMSFIFLFLCSVVVKISLGLKVTRGRATKGITARAGLEKARAQVWGCLSDRGYPGATCLPTINQKACLPAGIDGDFSGTYPACRMKLSLKL